MNTMSNALHDFRDSGAKELLRRLKASGKFGDDESVGMVYSLSDIAESVEKIYFKLMPTILGEPQPSTDVLEDVIWGIQADLMHIDYHIHDGWFIAEGWYSEASVAPSQE